MKWNIVIVDDDPFVLRMHAEMLKIMGHSITSFECPVQALKHLQENVEAIDLLITDYRMPKINGLELIARLQEGGIEYPAMIITGHIGEVDASRAQSLNCRVVSKPLPMHLLESHINSCIKAAEAT